MILVTGERIGPLVAEELQVPLHTGDLGDLVALSKAMRGVQRIFVEDGPHAVDALSLAEQLGAYHAVVLTSSAEESDAVRHVQLSSLRWTVLQEGPSIDTRDLAAIAGRTLAEEGHENSTYVLPQDAPALLRQVR